MSTLTLELINKFSIEGDLQDIAVLKRGHINETFVSVWQTRAGEKKFVHQCVNREVFPDVPLIMRNIATVTAHVRAKLASKSGVAGERTLAIIPARNGDLWVLDENDEYWRTYDFVAGATCIDVCTDPDQGYRAAKAFGRFERYLSDLSPSEVHEPIPHFQDSMYRFKQLKDAAQKNAAGRLRGCMAELDFALDQEKLAAMFADQYASGKVPVRVTHGDMKVNNVLLSATTGEGICIVDLDTCMPGTILYDFGDLCRTTTVPAAEDEQDFSLVRLGRELFDAVARGFLMEAGAKLTDAERSLMHLAPQLLALTIGIRFLADHINGDKYFRVHHDNHNLERARTQMQVVRMMQGENDWMERTVRRCLS